MTKQLLKAVSAAGVAALLVAPAAPGAAADLKARVPFSFTANEVAMPAGTYDLSVSNGVVSLRGMRGGVVALTAPLQAPGSRSCKLVFERRGDAYRLDQVWTGEFGRQLPRSDRESKRRGALTASHERVEVPLL